jgi:hypothetical protein
MALENQMSRYGAIAKSLPMGSGKVFFVLNASDAYAGDFQNEYPVDKDGVPRVYIGAANYADLAIQGALDACVANRNDYVFVMPSAATYTLNAALTMSKKNVHLIAPGGLGRANGSNNSTRVQAAAACNFVDISAASVEIAGFYIKNYTAIGAIGCAAGSTAVAPWIHHNTFFIATASGANLPIITGTALGDGGWFGVIEDNHFLTYGVAGGTMTGVILFAGAAGMMQVNRNHIGIATIVCATGISIASNGSEVCDNYLYEIGVGAGSTAGTLTIGIQLSGASVAINNRIGMATTDIIAGNGNYFAIGNVGGLAGTTAWIQ